MILIFFLVRFFNYKQGHYLWFDKEEINLYTTKSAGMYYLPASHWGEKKYAIFIANLDLINKYKIKKPNTVYTLVDLKEKEEFEKRHQINQVTV